MITILRFLIQRLLVIPRQKTLLHPSKETRADSWFLLAAGPRSSRSKDRAAAAARAQEALLQTLEHGGRGGHRGDGKLLDRRQSGYGLVSVLGPLLAVAVFFSMTLDGPLPDDNRNGHNDHRRKKRQRTAARSRSH